MIDPVLKEKAGLIEQCLRRIDEEYSGYEDQLEHSQVRMDSIVLNLLRACENVIVMATYLVRKHDLGDAKDGRSAIRLLEQAKCIDRSLGENMQSMISFRIVSVHDYNKLDVIMIKAILEQRLGEFSRFIRAIEQFTNG